MCMIARYNGRATGGGGRDRPCAVAPRRGIARPLADWGKKLKEDHTAGTGVSVVQQVLPRRNNRNQRNPERTSYDAI